MANSGISVIVCCYNSSLRIKETLHHLSAQKVPEEINWEVIVVDNASTDDTAAIANAVWMEFGKFQIKFSVVTQPIAGLSHAREKGVELAKYDYLVFCDDDNWLSENFVETAFNLMYSNPQTGVLGGHGFPVYEECPPEWFKQFEGSMAIGPQSINESDDITDSKGYVYGAASVYRKSIINFLKENGFASLLTDRLGNSLSTGGDLEWSYAIKLAGYRIWYSDSLRFKHFLPKSRTNWNYLVKLHKAHGKGASNLLCYMFFFKNQLNRPAYKKTWYWYSFTLAYMTAREVLRTAYRDKRKALLMFYSNSSILLDILRNRKKTKANYKMIQQAPWRATIKTEHEEQ